MKIVYGLAWYDYVNGLFCMSLWNCVTLEIVCFPKRILRNRLFEHSASRWQFCIRIGCSQVWLNSICRLYIDNSVSWLCGFCRSYICLSITTPGKESSQWLILPLEVPSFPRFMDPLLPTFWQQLACPVRQSPWNMWFSRWAEVPGSWVQEDVCEGSRLVLLSSLCWEPGFSSQSHSLSRGADELFFLVAAGFPPLPSSLLVWNTIWFCLPAPWVGVLVSMPLTFQAGNGFSFLRGCYAALAAWLGVGWAVGGWAPFFLNCFLALRDS